MTKTGTNTKLLQRLMTGLLVALVVGGGAGVVWWRLPRVTIQPYVQDGEDDAAMVVAFATDRPCRAIVVYSPVDGSKTYRAHSSKVTDRHEITLAHTKLDTDYTYNVRIWFLPAGNGGVLQGKRSSGQPLRFVVFGDSGSGSRSQAKLADMIWETRPDFVVHTGDIVYPRGEMEGYPPNYFEPYEDMIRSVPVYPVLGNHDVRISPEPYYVNFVLPTNGPPACQPERHYTFNYGDAFFVMFDSDVSEKEIADHVAPWVEQQLLASEATWKFVVCHHPAYTSGGHLPTPKIQEHIVPAMERGGADMMLNGHNHLYERSYPIREGAVVEPGEGIVYVVTGAGGMSKYEFRDPMEEYTASAFNQFFSFTVIELDGPKLTLTQYPITGMNKPVDRWEFVK